MHLAADVLAMHLVNVRPRLKKKEIGGVKPSARRTCCTLLIFNTYRSCANTAYVGNAQRQKGLGGYSCPAQG